MKKVEKVLFAIAIVLALICFGPKIINDFKISKMSKKMEQKVVVNRKVALNTTDKVNDLRTFMDSVVVYAEVLRHLAEDEKTKELFSVEDVEKLKNIRNHLFTDTVSDTIQFEKIKVLSQCVLLLKDKFSRFEKYEDEHYSIFYTKGSLLPEEVQIDGKTFYPWKKISKINKEEFVLRFKAFQKSLHRYMADLAEISVKGFTLGESTFVNVNEEDILIVMSVSKEKTKQLNGFTILAIKPDYYINYANK